MLHMGLLSWEKNAQYLVFGEDLQENGLKENADHSIGATIPSVVIVNSAGLEIAEMTNSAWESISGYNK